MRIAVLTGVVVLALLAAVPCLDLAFGQDGNQGGFAWIEDFQKGRELAREQGKPLLVVFR